MALEIIPAIDLSNGQAVRLKEGSSDAAPRVAEDPIKVARKFQEAGATRLHIVDLDGAKVGSPRNLLIVRDIVRKVSIPVQLGGGLRTTEIIESVFRVVPTLDRFIVGTTAASTEDALMLDILHRWGEKVIVGADTTNGYIAVQDWTERSHETTAEFGQRLIKMGARRFLCTDISRNGTLQGIDVEATRAFGESVKAPVLASGSISGPEDIQKLVSAAQPNWIEGVIIGKALYAGRLTLPDALRIAAGG